MNIFMIYYKVKQIKTLLQSISSFGSTSFYLIIFLFCLHFCLLSHFKIIRRILKSLITTLMYFLLKYNWKNKTWKELFGSQSLGMESSILVSKTAWIDPWYFSLPNLHLWDANMQIPTFVSIIMIHNWALKQSLR